MGVSRDVTERKRAEQELRQSHDRLEQALAELQRTQQRIIQQERLRALGQMASGIAHDFNNVLSPILGFSELLLDRPASLDDRKKVIHYLKIMNTAARDAATVVRRLREFYCQREEGEVFLPVHLNQMVEQTLNLTQPRWKDQAQAQGISIRIETELQEIPTIAGNEAELREVLTNVIFNAIDAMPQGGTIAIRTCVIGEFVVLEVSDNGMGMNEEVRRRSLEPFFSTKGDHGTGLGLAMVHGIVRRHEGKIAIESEPGKGTTLVISLPKGKEANPQNGGAPVAPLSSALRVLLVDDEPLVRETITAYLTSDGHMVDTAANGREGLQKFCAGQFDLVITDRGMPEMNGDQLAVAVKHLVCDKPIILLTGWGSHMNADGVQPEGVDLVLSKPVRLDELRAAMRQLDPPRPHDSRLETVATAATST